MKKQISRIALRQTAKVIAILVFILMAIISIPIGIYLLFTPERLSAISFFILPFIYALLAYIFWVVWGWFYNLIAKRTGGIEFDLKDVE